MTDTLGDSLRVLERMTRVLDAFDAEDHGLSITDLVRRADLPKSTVSRLVATLVQQGYLERDGHVLHLGLRVFELGQLARTAQEVRAVARPIMRDLRDSSGLHVHLALHDGYAATCISVLRGPAGGGSSPSVGSRLTLREDAMGLAILAHLPPADAHTADRPPMPPPAGAIAVSEPNTGERGWRAAHAFFAPGPRVAGSVAVSGSAGGLDARTAALLRGAAEALTRDSAALSWMT